MLRFLCKIICLVLVGCSSIQKAPNPYPILPLPKLAATKPLTELWHAKSGRGVGDLDFYLQLAPSPQLLVTVDSKGQVIAINPQSGKRVWQVTTKLDCSAGPAIYRGQVVVAAANGTILALQLDTGRRLWQSNVNSEVLATPTITKNYVLIASIDGGLSALSTLDGRLLWRYQQAVPSISLRRSARPLVVGEQVIQGFANGTLHAVELATGKAVWQQTIGQPSSPNELLAMVDLAADPSLHRNQIFVSSYQQNISALDALNGEILWQNPQHSIHGFAIFGDNLVVASNRGWVLALKTNTGKILWQQRALQGRRLGAPKIAAGKVLIGDNLGYLFVLDAKSGSLLNYKKIARAGIEAPIITAPPYLYLMAKSGSLYKLKLPN